MERVWDYPRPPAVVPCERRVRIELAGEVLADSTRALRVLETSHPPTIYIPLADVREELLAENEELRSRLAEAEDILSAIRSGEGAWPPDARADVEDERGHQH